VNPRTPPDATAGRPSGNHPSWHALGFPDSLVDLIAERVAARIIEHLPKPVEPYMTVEEAAEYLGCRRRKNPEGRIYELVDQRRLNCYRDGRRLLFRREDLDAVLSVEIAK
jgi:excisionase family DNA binding protein